ncbi:MAG: DNA-processing protein DprA [Brevinema sp.]
MNKKLFALAAFSATDLIGWNRYKKITQKFPDIEDFLDCDIDFQYQFLQLQNEESKKILTKMKDLGSFVLETCEKKNIQLIDWDHPEYPKLLKNISSPPFLLYRQGNVYPHVPLIGVIGTRKHTAESEKINEWFCSHFVEYGIGVVSGLAYGHDSIAARSVLKNEGFTIGVLGTAIDVVYPVKLKKLYDEVKEHGALISEYPPGMASTKWRFPRRNRIVSGISQALLVIQAPEKSGTMITVQMALEQQKDVYVVPGNPTISQYKGSNRLIQEGSKIALDPADIVQDILKSSPNHQSMRFMAQRSIPEMPKQIDTNIPIEQQKILELSATEIHFDEIAEVLQINIATLTAILTIMEINNLIVQKPGQLYLRR